MKWSIKQRETPGHENHTTSSSLHVACFKVNVQRNGLNLVGDDLTFHHNFSIFIIIVTHLLLILTFFSVSFHFYTMIQGTFRLYVSQFGHNSAPSLRADWATRAQPSLRLMEKVCQAVHPPGILKCTVVVRVRYC